MNTPAISVVLPVYNGEKYLAEAIESILNQTYKNFEFIIINDGSTDRSLDIINDYATADSRINVISRNNKGLVYSLNEGIALAKGKYIARMDADDISLPERFEKQYDYMEKNPDVVILGTFIEAFGDINERNKSFSSWFNYQLNDENIYLRITEGCPIAHSSVMMKSEFAKFYRYDFNYSALEDYELWARAFKMEYKISNVDTILLKFRLHEGSKSNIEKGNRVIKQRIELKLNYFFEKNKRGVLIWGAGSGGHTFVHFVQSSKWNEKLNILAVVDKEKEGYLNGIKIIRPCDIDKIRHNYIFITSSLGYKEISCYLNAKGLGPIRDYLYII